MVRRFFFLLYSPPALERVSPLLPSRTFTGFLLLNVVFLSHCSSCRSAEVDTLVEYVAPGRKKTEKVVSCPSGVVTLEVASLQVFFFPSS